MNYLADQYNFDQSANVFSKEISYSLQPTDDNKAIFTEISDSTPVISFVTEVVESVLSKPILESQM